MAAESHDDEDMADLFSFGSGENASGGIPNSGGTGIVGVDATNVSAAPYRSNSADSFLDLLEDSPEILSGSSTSDGAATHDAETQEILAWLDEESPTMVESETSETEQEVKKSKPETPVKPVKKAEPPKPTTETVVALPPVFKSLTAALASSQATTGQIRHLAADHLEEITHVNRPDLLCRLLTGKSLSQTESKSSLADSFHSWQTSESRKDEIAPRWMQLTCESLAERVAESLEKTHATHRDKEACRQDLLDVLQYYWRGLPKPSSTNEGGNQNETIVEDRDWFIPPVAATILGFSIQTPVASVLLNQVIGQYMPVLALQSDERWEAAKGLHQHLYWLACYHLPLLVFHLDRYWPGWCAPRFPQQENQTSSDAPTVQARHLEERGLVPPSWLVSLMAGDVSFLPVAWMGQIWDWILTAPSRSVPFFLTLAVLEKSADDLILVTGDELKHGLIKAFEFDESSEWLESWWDSARALQSATPRSVLEQLEKAEDEAVQQAVVQRQERAEAELAARLKAEQEAYQEEQERKAEEARQRLTRARLVAFYRKHAPDKEGNIDQILENYGDRLEILDAKLFKKYGESFNPALKEKKNRSIGVNPNKLLATMNQGLKRGNSNKQEEEELSPTEQIEAPAASKTEQVSVLVKPEEVLPIICWSKEAAAMRGASRRSRVQSSSTVPLKFFLVDSRSEDAAEEQGRFPTAVSLSPETMLDPERLQKAEEQFESLRGSVHIVVMGEGFSAIPKLYDQKLSSKFEVAMKQDESRTNICALFFFKKGFPFVSILDGGFAAAHAWLVREGPSHHLEASSVLVDYNAENSLFGQMEKLRSASATEKASRAMQSLMEKSLVAITMQAQQLERLASDMEQGKGRFGMGFLANRAKFQASERKNSNDENKGPRFVNPFTNKSNENTAPSDTPRFSNPFNRQRSGDDNVEPSDQSKETPNAGESNVGSIPFRNPFARKQADGAEAEKSGVSPEGADESLGETDGGAKPSLSNPFKGLGAAINNTVNRTGEGLGSSDNASSVDAKPAMSNPFKGIGAALNNTMTRASESSTPEAGGTVANLQSQTASSASETKASTGTDKRNNMFGGLGAAFNNATKSADDNRGKVGQGQAGTGGVSNMLKRNPFRGFGGGGGAGTRKTTEDSKKGGGFGGGLNSLRSGFGRMRQPGSRDEGDAPGGSGEESISFN